MANLLQAAYIHEHVVLQRRNRLHDPHDPLANMTDAKAFEYFRFRKQSIYFITNLLERHFGRDNDIGSPYPLHLQNLITLRYLGANCFYHVSEKSVIDHVSKSFAWQAVKLVTGFLADLAPDYIGLEADDCQQLQEEFMELRGFPKTIGAIDCTKILVDRPTTNDYFVYRDRNRKYCLNVQAVASPRYLILDLSVDWPGSVNDSEIFKNSGIYERLINHELPGTLVGDSAYECRRFILTPFLAPEGQHQIDYNTAQMGTRVPVECTFGIWKARFTVLKTGLRTRNPQKASTIIWACAVLHNLGIIRGDILPEDEWRGLPPEPQNNDEPARQQDQDGLNYRRWFAQRYFS